MKRLISCLVGLALVLGSLAQVQAGLINIGNWSGSGRSWNNSQFTAIKNAMTTAGHTIEADNAISVANLANDQMFIVGEGAIPNASEILNLFNWVNGGGSLLIFTNSNFTGGPGGNAILSGFSSSMSFTGAFINASGPFQGGNFATTGPPHNLVGQNMSVSPGNIVNGGTTLYGQGLHFEQIGSGFVYAFGDRYDHNTFNPNATNNNGKLFLNIAQGSMATPIPEPSTYLLFGIGILAVFGAGYRQRKKAA